VCTNVEENNSQLLGLRFLFINFSLPFEIWVMINSASGVLVKHAKKIKNNKSNSDKISAYTFKILNSCTIFKKIIYIIICLTSILKAVFNIFLNLYYVSIAYSLLS
jgi:hypothetical protein